MFSNISVTILKSANVLLMYNSSSVEASEPRVLSSIKEQRESLNSESWKQQMGSRQLDLFSGPQKHANSAKNFLVASLNLKPSLKKDSKQYS